MAYGTRAERPTLRPQAKSDADRFLDRCELILTRISINVFPVLNNARSPLLLAGSLVGSIQCSGIWTKLGADSP